MASKYLLEKIARHGAAAQRLIREREDGQGEFAESSEVSAIAFDAADFVWAYLTLQGYEEAQESRCIRNYVAEEIVKVLEGCDWLRKDNNG
jgi:hypothetical protein